MRIEPGPNGRILWEIQANDRSNHRFFGRVSYALLPDPAARGMRARDGRFSHKPSSAWLDPPLTWSGRFDAALSRFSGAFDDPRGAFGCRKIEFRRVSR